MTAPDLSTSAPGEPSVAADVFADALAKRGVVCRIEGRDALAVLHAGSHVGDRLTDPARRRLVLELGRAHGFTHVALAIGED